MVRGFLHRRGARALRAFREPSWGVRRPFGGRGSAAPRIPQGALALVVPLGLVPGNDWQAVGHGARALWLEFVGRFGAMALLAILVGLVLLAFLRRRQYRAVAVLGGEELEALREEIARVERRTVGEVVPVVLERSDDHPAAAWVAGLFTFLLGSALLAPWLPWERPELLVPVQLLLGGIGFALAHALPDFARRFVREDRASEMAQEQAFQEFYRHGLHETEARTGVLLFVSLFERRVVVLGDEGIAARVPAEFWEATDRAILEGIRRGSLFDGLREGIRRTGEVLAEHFPWQAGDRDELPNRVVVRRR